MRLVQGFVPSVVGMVLVAGGLTARGVTALAEAKIGAFVPTAPPLAESASVPPAPPRDAAPLVAHNPFDRDLPVLRAPGTESSGGAAPPERCDGVHLHAIVASTDETWSFAALTEDPGPSVLRRQGDRLGARLVRFIGGDHVVLEGARGTCVVPLYTFASEGSTRPTSRDSPTVRASPTVGAPLDGAIARGIQALGANDFAVDRGVLESILERQAELLGTTRLQPVKDGDRVLGMRIAAVPPDGLLAHLGFASGDTLVTIGGYPVSDPEKMLLAYGVLRSAPRVEVEIQRAGRPARLTYEVR